VTDEREAFSAWFLAGYPGQEARLGTTLQFHKILEEASHRMSLVSRGDRNKLLTAHFQECLDPELISQLQSAHRILDVGTGGGLPGVLLAIMLPETPVTWLEPRERRTAFLERCRLQLGLRQATVSQARIETLAPQGELFDAITARALRWTPIMVKNMEAIAAESATLLRFGAEGPLPAGVTHSPLGAGRFLQKWPRNTWAALPKAP